MEDLDLGYKLMELLSEHPRATVGPPLNLHGKQEYAPLEALCQTWSVEKVYANFCLLEEYGLVERAGDPACYVLTHPAMGFVGRVNERGGWATVKNGAIDCPVRQVMSEVCRWVYDGCPSVEEMLID